MGDPERLAHFRIVARLGQGGMGIVYKAEDEKLRRTVALKVLPPSAEDDPDRRARLLREARAAAAVTHPNIATVHEIGEADGRVFIAMEYVEGRTLRAMLADGPLPVAECLAVATQVARGLARAHQAHVVHRDLKPDNVMVGEDGHVKVLDFGLAKVVAPQAQPGAPSSAVGATLANVTTATSDGRLVGTPQYMSPEQTRGKEVDATSDVFSFGVTLYEMVTGRRPFEGPTITDVVIAIDRDAPPRPCSVRPGVPEALERVIDRCLEKAPARRYADGRALLEDLVALASGAPVSAGPAVQPPPAAAPPAPAPPRADSLLTPSPQSMQPARAKKRSWWLIALAVVGLVGVTRQVSRCGGGGGGGGGGAGGGKEGEAVRAAVASAVASAIRNGGGPRSSRRGAAAGSAASRVALACPPLAASGVEEPSGWLGAGAANVTCRRAAILMGGRLERVAVPAELLDLPRQPTDDFPRDPYGADHAREHAIEAAKARAEKWLDGRVEKTRDGFRVELVVRDSDGSDEERADGSGHHVYLAVREAMKELVENDALDRVGAVDPEIATWTGVKDVDLALALDDWHDSLASSPVSTRDAVAKLAEHRAELGPLWPAIQWESQLPELTELDAFDPVALDRSSPAAFARSAVSYAQTAPGADAAALEKETAKLREAETSRVGRRTLLIAQAFLAERAGQMDRAMELMLGELRDEPRCDHCWEIPWLALQGQANLGPLSRAFAAWQPEDHAAWSGISTGDTGLKDTAARLPFARRAYEISPDFPLWGDTLGKQLVELGRPAEARSLATTMLAVGPLMDPAAQSILVLVDATQGSFGAAVKRGTEALGRVDRFGEQLGDWYLIDSLAAAATTADLGAAAGEAFATRFVLVDPPKLAHGYFFGGSLVLSAADACTLAPRETAKRCLAKLKQLLATGYFPDVVTTVRPYIDGCARWAQGDLAGAAAAWRPLVAGHAADAGYAGNAIARLGPAAFDAAGEHALAERIDAHDLATGFDAFAGASLADVRQARRAAGRGDRAEARRLAQKVVDAWSAADVAMPAVVEMKALLAKGK